MKNVTKISVTLSFPLGAHFYSSIHIIVYKQLMKFIYRLNCIANAQKCIYCPMNKHCRYFICTGENYQFYPGILLHQSMFEKSIYIKEENITFEFYLIGNMKEYVEYIRLFFSSYLNQKIAGSVFYLKNIDVQQLEDNEVQIIGLKSITIMANNFVLEEINQMIDYYNDRYSTAFRSVEVVEYQVLKSTNFSMAPVHLNTKIISIKGTLPYIHLTNSIAMPKVLKTIGIGKYNFIGGGYFEIED